MEKPNSHLEHGQSMEQTRGFFLLVQHRSITTPVSLLANDFDVQKVLHGQVSLAAVNKILCNSWGYELMQKSKDSLKNCFENVNIVIWRLMCRFRYYVDLYRFSYLSCINSNRKKYTFASILPSIETIYTCMYERMVCLKHLISILEPRHGISNNVIHAMSKASDQPEHTCSLIRASASCLNILWLLSYWLSTIWSF